MESAPNLFSYRKFWAKRFGVAPFLPMSRPEMETLGWDSCDIIIVTGDAYIDHPSFGMAIIGRLLEAQGFRVGIISQPDWKSPEPFKTLGEPNLFFGITAGNMDSMVNNYTADRKIRSDDVYTPNGEPHKRPNHAVTVYAQRCREAYKDAPIVIGGIEASLRRLAHYDYWSDKVQRSILFDSKADLLIYGNAERAIVELAHRLAKKEPIETITDLRGTAFITKEILPLYSVMDGTTLGSSIKITPDSKHRAIGLPSFEQVANDPLLYAHASRIFHLETNPGNARALVQAHGDRKVWLNPPPLPLTTEELDGVYVLPFCRLPHPSYGDAKIPAYEMIRFSVTIQRGCFGGCSFCSITAHEGRIVQSRSETSILGEISEISQSAKGFTGIISDLGGPTANMYKLKCKDTLCETMCRRLSCIYPKICKNLNTSHTPLINLYRKARALPHVKKILIGSGVRYDLAIKSPQYIAELVRHHVGGYLKIAPEHIAPRVLAKMLKPEINAYYIFKKMFDQYSMEAGKEQYLIPYFIAAHPGTTDNDMLDLALWLKANNYRLEQVQTFLPTPMTLATTMYWTGRNPLGKIDKHSEKVFIPKSGQIRKRHKAFLHYHNPVNWPLLRDALKHMHREDLIGNGKRHLIPPWKPRKQKK